MSEPTHPESTEDSDAPGQANAPHDVAEREAIDQGPPSAAAGVPSLASAGPGPPSGPPTPARSAAPTPPTPVRQAMEPTTRDPDPEEPAERVVHAPDGEWIVRIEGRARSGRSLDAGAPLLLLSFAKRSEPTRRLLEATLVGRRLSAIDEDRLVEALGDAEPFQEEWTAREIFAHTRRSRAPR